MVGGTGINVTPPVACTPEMVRDGIEAKPPSGVGEKAWWLRQSLTLIPPSTWSKRFGQTPESMIEQLNRSEWRDEVIEAWSDSALLHGDTEWIWALLNARATLAAATRSGVMRAVLDQRLFDALPDARREQYVLRQLTDTLDWAHPAIALLQRCSFPWSEALGHEVLQALKRGVANSADNGAQFHLLASNPMFGCHIPISLIEDAETDWLNGHLATKNPTIAASSWAPLMETLKFRRAMHEEFDR